jgi:hypothetical protein
MPITQRLYEKAQSAVIAQPTPTPSTTISATPSVTPSISITPSVTPSITPSVTVTPSISITPTPSPSSAYCYTVNIYNCSTAGGNINCGQFIGQTTLFSYNTNLSMSFYYPSASYIIQPISMAASSSAATFYTGSTGYNNCALACSASLAP